MKHTTRSGVTAGLIATLLMVLASACGEDERSSAVLVPEDSGTADARDSSADARTERDARSDAVADAPGDGRCFSELVYQEPGCDGSVGPVCYVAGDAVCETAYFCDCEGNTVQGCTYAKVPYRSAGACSDGGAGEAGPDADVDGG